MYHMSYIVYTYVYVGDHSPSQARQNQALQDPTLLTSLSFSDCKNIHPNSKRALVEDMGLQTMTEVQAKTFAAALAGKDILVRARTGTGKQ